MKSRGKNIPGRVKSMCKGPKVEGTSALLRNCKMANQAAEQRMRLCGTRWRVNQRTDHAGLCRPSKDFSLYPIAHGTKVFIEEPTMALYPRLLMLLICVLKNSNNGLNC